MFSVARRSTIFMEAMAASNQKVSFRRVVETTVRSRVEVGVARSGALRIVRVLL